MPEQYKQIVAALGILPADKIAELDALTVDQLKDFKADGYVGDITTGMRTAALNDNEFLKTIDVQKLPSEVQKTIEKAQYGRFMNEMKSNLKAAGIDYEDLSEADQNSLKTLLTKGLEKHAAKIGAPDAQKQLQAQLQAAIKEKEDLEGSWTKKHQEELDKLTSKYSSTMEKSTFSGKISRFDTKVPASMISESVLAIMKNDYHVTFEAETGVFTATQKTNPSLPVMEGSKILTFDELLDKVMKASQLLNEKKEEGQEGKKKTMEIEGGKTKEVPEYIRKQMGI
jgi:type I site-specific restriction endonuclease